MGQGVTPGAESNSDIQRELEEFGEDAWHQTPTGAEPMDDDDDDGDGDGDDVLQLHSSSPSSSSSSASSSS